MLFFASSDPPKEIKIKDEFGHHVDGIIGPFKLGSNISFICEVYGGVPYPSLSWWLNGHLHTAEYNESPSGFVYSKLELKNLSRDLLLKHFTCKASNSNLTTSLTKTVIIDIICE